MDASDFKFIIVALTWSNLLLSPVYGEVLVLFEQSDGKGEALPLDVESCTSMPRGWNAEASSIKTNGYCFELYGNKHCVGDSVRVHRHHSDIINLKDVSFDNLVGSIKPCSTINPDMPPLPLSYGGRFGKMIRVYEYAGRAGQHADLRISNCVNYPPALQRNTASVDTRGSCVRLYEEMDCKGDVVQLQPNDSNSDNLHFVDFIDKAVSAGPCFGRQR